MLKQFYAEVMAGNQIAAVIISIALMLFLGFAMTRLTKLLRLPSVTAYIVAGILMGPYCLKLVPVSVIEGMGFLSDIALAFIAFSTGEFFKLSTLRKNAAKVALITLLEACLAPVLVFIALYFALGINLPFAIVLSALAAATASASTMMTIRQTNARGDFVDTLLQVVALDNVVGLILYSMSISLAMAVGIGGAHAGRHSVITPVAVNAAVLALGALFGLILKLLMPKRRSEDNRLIISVSLLFAFCGICALLDASPLLGCMSMGMVYINLTGDEKLFKQMNYFTPPILLLFFVRSGLSFKLDLLVNSSAAAGGASLLAIGVAYFISRIAGKYLGAFMGCAAVKKPPKVRNYLGLALIPQAGVAIGLAALGARKLGGESGRALETIILASSVLYELIGPACAKLSLYLSGSYSNKIEDIVPDEQVSAGAEATNAVELLIRRIQRIQADLPAPSEVSEEEQAFLEAASDQLAAMHSIRRAAPKHRRR